MKAINLNRIKNIGLLFVLLLTVSSCQSEEAKGLFGFLAGFVIFLVGIIFSGIPAIVFSSMSITSTKPSTPSLAILFTVLTTIFLFVQMSIFSSAEDIVMLFPLITFGVVVLCVVFIVLGFSKRKKGFTSKADESDTLLDDIINDTTNDELI